MEHAHENRIGIRFLLWGIGVLLLTLILTFPITRVGDPEARNWKALKEIQMKGQILDFAIVGDSHAHTSLSPKIISEVLAGQGIQQESGQPLVGHNFAVDGTDVLHQAYFVLYGLLKQPNPPKRILYVPNALQFNSRRLNNRLEQLGTPFVTDLRAVGAPLEVQLDLLTMKWVPAYRYRPLIMKKISDYVEVAGKKTLPIQERFMGLTQVYEPTSRKYETQPDGFEPFEVLEFTERFKRGSKAYIADYASLEISEWHLGLARRFLNRARELGIQVYVIEPPESKWFRENLANSEKQQHWRKEIQKISSENGAVLWQHSDHWNDDDQIHFGDPSHISKSAAVEYSTFIGQELGHAF